MTPQKKNIVRFIILAFVVFLAVAFAYYFKVFETIQERMNDRFFLKRDASPNIIIIAIDDVSIEAIGKWPWPRKIFAELVGKLQDARTIAIDVSFSEKSPLGDLDDLELEKAFEHSSARIVLPVERERGRILVSPLPIFQKNATLGFVDVTADSDGIIRHSPIHDNLMPSFAFAISQKNREDYASSIRLSYVGPAKTILTIPAIDVLRDKVPKRILEGNTILIGVTASNLHDFVSTPFGIMSGVEYHANVLQALLENKIPKEAPRELGLLLLGLCVGLVSALMFFIRRIYLLLSALVIFFVILVLIIFIGFSFDFIFPSFYILLGYIGSVITVGLLLYVTESKEKRLIRQMFQFYLAPSVLEHLMADHTKLRLGGEKRQTTILFSDIRGFTTISEKLPPEELTHIINEYLSVMTDIIMEKRGLVDKYIGDAIMAFWGAPLQNENQAEDACRSVLKMSEGLKILNKSFEKKNKPPLDFGVGLNKGEVVVGNIGSTKRFNYTIMGDEVNFCSRLEGLTKAYGVRCLVSESVVSSVKSADIHFRELDLVKVKGKKEPKRIFELVTKEITDDFRKMLDAFEKGRLAYKSGKWEEATVHFKQALSFEEDAPSRLLLERTEILKKNPPFEWNGVYEFQTK